MNSLKVDVIETSQIGEARRMASSLAQNLGFTEIETSKAAIVASEMASNLARYADQGEIVYRSITTESWRGLELLSVDKGPGISDVEESMRDGFSTHRSAGIGLGAIARQSDTFDLYTVPGKGTVILAQVWSVSSAQAHSDAQAETGAVSLPVIGQSVSGDSWAMDLQNNARRFLVVDGLGHGIGAAEAAQEAVRLFHEHSSLSPAEFVELAHAGLHKTRGAVLAVAEVDPAQGMVRYCGVGNICGLIYSEGQTSGLVSYEGIVGHNVTRIREFSYSYQANKDPLLVLHSDGLGTHWNLNLYPALVRRHPSLIAGVLYRDFKRPNDDVTVLVSRLA